MKALLCNYLHGTIVASKELIKIQPPSPSLQQWRSRDKPRQKGISPPCSQQPRGEAQPCSREEALDEAQVPHGLHDEVAALQQPVGLVGPLQHRRPGALLLPGATGLLGTAQHINRRHQPAWLQPNGAPHTATAEQYPLLMDLFIIKYSDEDGLLSPLPRKADRG